MGELVDDLLLLARLDQGRPLEADPVDLAALARDAVADARAVEPDRPIAIDTPAEPGDGAGRRAPAAPGGRQPAGQRPQPTPRPAPRSTCGSAPGAGRALLEVADQGPGIPPEVGNRVFERFYRGDPARVRDGTGAGLGLSIVAAVAASHHGQAWVESEPGHGARFRVELPLAGFTANSQGVRSRFLRWGWWSALVSPPDPAFAIRRAPRAHPPATDAIVTRGLTKRYGDRCVVDHLDFTVPTGDGVRVRGPQRLGQDHHHPHAARAGGAHRGHRRDPGPFPRPAPGLPARGWGP